VVLLLLAGALLRLLVWVQVALPALLQVVLLG
jgi:hypothetical protein